MALFRKNRRSSNRTSVKMIGPISLLHEDGGEANNLGSARVYDISRGGCCLGFEGGQGPDLESRLSLTLPIHREWEAKLEGTVVWKKPGRDGGCRFGIQFQHMDRELRRGIEQYISDLNHLRKHSSSSGRHHSRHFSRRKVKAITLLALALALGVAMVMLIAYLPTLFQDQKAVHNTTNQERVGVIDSALQGVAESYRKKLENNELSEDEIRQLKKLKQQYLEK